MSWHVTDEQLKGFDSYKVLTHLLLSVLHFYLLLHFYWLFLGVIAVTD